MDRMNKPTIKENSRVAICKVCRKVSSDFDYHVRQTTLNGIKEVGLVCPKCNEWYHSYFANKELEMVADKVPTMRRKERRLYQLNFNKLQKKIRKKLNMRKVNNRWIYV